MTEIVMYATPATGVNAGLTLSTMLPVLGPILALGLGLLILGWMVRRALTKPVPMDLQLPESRVPGDQLIRERFRPRAADLLGRRSRF